MTKKPKTVLMRLPETRLTRSRIVTKREVLDNIYKHAKRHLKRHQELREIMIRTMQDKGATVTLQEYGNELLKSEAMAEIWPEREIDDLLKTTERNVFMAVPILEQKIAEIEHELIDRHTRDTIAGTHLDHLIHSAYGLACAEIIQVIRRYLLPCIQEATNTSHPEDLGRMMIEIQKREPFDSVEDRVDAYQDIASAYMIDADIMMDYHTAASA